MTAQYIEQLVEELKKKVEDQEERIRELEWKVEEMHKEYRAQNDPYLNG